jgi:hypothetical protein
MSFPDLLASIVGYYQPFFVSWCHYLWLFGNKNSENYNKQTSTWYIKELIFFVFLSFDVFDKHGDAEATQTGDGWIKSEGTRRERVK